MRKAFYLHDVSRQSRSSPPPAPPPPPLRINRLSKRTFALPFPARDINRDRCRSITLATARNGEPSNSAPSPLPSPIPRPPPCNSINYCCITASLCIARESAPPSLSLRNPFRSNSAAALWKRAISQPGPRPRRCSLSVVDADYFIPARLFRRPRTRRDLKRPADWPAALFIRSFFLGPNERNRQSINLRLD